MLDSSRELEAPRVSQMLAQARALGGTGQLSQARALLAEIVKANSDHTEALHMLGVIAAMNGESELAADLLGRAVGIEPHNPAYQNDLGVVFKRLRRWDAALACLAQAIALSPGFAEAHNNRGNVLRELDESQSAIECFRQAIALKPDYAEAHHNLGVAFSDLNLWERALASFGQALALRPGYANAYCNRGLALERLNRLDAALADYDAAIANDHGMTQAFANRGNLLRELGRPAAAVESCDQALALDPAHAQAHQNKSMALLLLGDYARGFAEFEWRWKNLHSPLSRDVRPFAQPLWLGEQALDGKTILLRAEQGLGDTLQFCRYAPLVARRGARVILEVQPPLVEVMRSLRGGIDVMARGDQLGDFDYQCPLMSLPLAFRDTLDSIPLQIPYLRADPIKSQLWRARLGRQVRPRVGLIWSGGFRQNLPEFWALHGRRNIALSALAPLHAAPVEFYSLQKGQPAESELPELVAQHWGGPKIHDLTGELQDFSDTAALIEQLDLVISVDTSTAHLAAALGKPVWLLNRFDTCWRWLLEREDSPWYPSMRLYRQQRLGDWDDVVRRVCEHLAVGQGTCRKY